MAATQLEHVMLKGNYRKEPATAEFERCEIGWQLTLVVGRRSANYSLGKYDKPCWSVAMKYMERMK